MANFDIVFAVAAELTLGRVLRASADNSVRKFGIVSCERALGAFDPRSEAWVRSNGRDVARWDSSAEAAEHARRLSGSSYQDFGYEALEIPERRLAVTVGPIRNAVGPVKFRCIDWSGGPGVEVETGDTSAFSAAMAFVALVGASRAEESIYERAA